MEDVRSNGQDEVEDFLSRRRRNKFAYLFNGLAAVKGERIKHQFARFDLGEIQDIVDDRQQRLGAELRTVSAYSRCSAVSGVSSSSPVMPMTPFIGVRISWLMLARNSLFAWAALSTRFFRQLSLLPKTGSIRRTCD